jgi:DNA-binding protein YbaB
MHLTLVTLGVYTECGQVSVRDVEIDPSVLATELDVIQAVVATNGLIPAKAESGLVKA